MPNLDATVKVRMKGMEPGPIPTAPDLPEEPITVKPSEPIIEEEIQPEVTSEPVPYDPQDDLLTTYAEVSKIREEINSPEYLGLSDIPDQETPEAKYTKTQKGVPESDIKAETGGLKDPWIDPTAAFTGGFTAPLKIGLSQGAKLFPTLVRALTSATTGAIMDVPIGVATEKMEEVVPWAALPFNVLTGMVSGVTIENAIEKGVLGFLEKRGIQSTPDLVKRITDAYKGSWLADETGSIRIFPEIDNGVKKALKTELTSKPDRTPEEQRILDMLGEAITPAKESTLSIEAKKPIVFQTEKIGKKAEGFLNLEAKDLPTDKAININFARIDSEDGIKEAIAKTAKIFGDEIQEARRGVITNEETAKLANLVGMTPEKLLQRRKGQAFKAEEALASRQILVASGRRLMDLANVISGKSPLQTAGEMTSKELAFEFEKQLALHAAIQEQVSGMTAEAGRALQSFNIKSKEYKGRLTQIDELMKRMSTRKIGTDKLATLVSTIDTAEGLSAFARQARKATTMDMLLEAWINALLSGPITHSVNSTSNALVAFMQVPERALGAGISKVFGDQAIYFGESSAQAYGMIAGFKDALKLAGKALVTGETSGQFEKVDLPMRRAIAAKNFGIDETSVAGRAVDLLGEAIRTPTRFLSGEDEFFKAIGYRMELQAQAVRMASKEGLKGNNFAKRVVEIVNDPPDDIRLASIDAATYQTFTKPLGEVGQAGMRFLNKAPALRLIVPFIQTPTNVMKYFGERTPVAALGLVPGIRRLPGARAIAEEIAAGGARRDMALAKMSLGSMIMATTGTLAASGYITGGGPKDNNLRQIKENTGWKPYSIKIGDEYYSYNRLEPLGSLLGVAADSVEIMSQVDDLKATEIGLAAVASVAKNITSKTFLQGLSASISAMEDPQRYGKRWIQGYTNSIVPTGVAQIERQVDPITRSTYSDEGAFQELLNAIRARIPGYSEDLPPQRNLWGRVIENEGSLGPDFISPIAMSTEKRSPIDEELVRIKAGIRKPSTTQHFDGVEIPLNPKEYDAFQVLVNKLPLPSTGKVLKQSLNDLIKTPEYRKVDKDEKRVEIMRLFLQARSQARDELLLKTPSLQNVVRDLKEQQDKLK